MKVGFVLSYGRNDSTLAAFNIATCAMTFGFDCEFLPIGNFQLIHPYWDKHILRERPTFTNWLKSGLSHIFIMETVANDVISEIRNKKIPCIFVTAWDELHDSDPQNLEMYDSVICPSGIVKKILGQQFELRNLTCIPWNCDVPLTIREKQNSKGDIVLYWPLDGSQSLRQPLLLSGLFEGIMREFPETRLNISYSDGIQPEFLQAIRALVGAHGSRVAVYANLSWERQQLLFGKSDLTLWPSLFESFGFVGLCSTAMGVPVIAFNYPLISEIIKVGRNGILVDCELSYNWCGVPSVKSDYRSFLVALRQVLRNPKSLDLLRKTVWTGIVERGLNFTASWQEILET